MNKEEASEMEMLPLYYLVKCEIGARWTVSGRVLASTYVVAGSRRIYWPRIVATCPINADIGQE